MPIRRSSLIPENLYGSATEEVRSLLSLADRVFEALKACRPTESSCVHAKSLIQAHLDRLVATDASIAAGMKHVKLVSDATAAGYLLGENGGREIAPGLEFSVYRAAILSLRRRMNAEAANDPDCRARIVPPIWPLYGKPSVFFEPRIARRFDHPSMLPWRLLCELESIFGDSLLFAVTRLDPENNPFCPLLEVGAMGFLPIGLNGEEFMVYAP